MSRDRRLSSLLAVVLVVSAAAPTAAQSPVIGPGREAEVVALLAPQGLGDEVVPGVRLAGVSIERESIVISFEGDGAQAQVVLVHPSAPGAPSRRSLSFAIRVQGQGRALEAAERVAASVERNDRTPFWRVTASNAGQAGPASTAPAGGLDAGVWASLGLVLFALAFARDRRALGAAHRRGEEPAPWAVYGLLAGVTLVAVVLRLWLSPETLLGAWPFTRESALAEALLASRALHGLCAGFACSVTRFELTSDATLTLASLTPAAVYLLARALGFDSKASIVSALALACLPLHVRFSRSEVAFIPSLLYGSLFFVQLLATLRARTSVGAALSLVLTLAWAPLALSARPLDLSLAPLALALVAFTPLSRRRAARRWMVGVALASVAFVVAADHLFAHFGSQVSEGLSPRILRDAAVTLFSDHDTLLNPSITPPALPALALLGVLWLGRTRPRVAVWLGAWLGLLYVAHAYVVPREVAMQARYQLHLAVAFCLLVGAGVAAASRRHPRALAPLCLLLSLSPELARPFLEDVAFDSQRELSFVREAAASLEPGATVLEYDGGQGLRFGRLLQRLEGDRLRSGVRSVAVDVSGDADHFDADVVRRARGSGPLYVYTGLPCLGLPGGPPPTVCERLARALPMEERLVRRFGHRAYDENIAPHLAPGEPITLRLYRVVAPGSHALDDVNAEQP